ncbi:MAG: hypothetical protein FWD49_08015 [Firmicutes bacterium]|nr:hypothetical protein [Bacillota bacterium]
MEIIDGVELWQFALGFIGFIALCVVINIFKRKRRKNKIANQRHSAGVAQGKYVATGEKVFSDAKCKKAKVLSLIALALTIPAIIFIGMFAKYVVGGISGSAGSGTSSQIEKHGSWLFILSWVFLLIGWYLTYFANQYFLASNAHLQGGVANSLCKAVCVVYQKIIIYIVFPVIITWFFLRWYFSPKQMAKREQNAEWREGVRERRDAEWAENVENRQQELRDWQAEREREVRASHERISWQNKEERCGGYTSIENVGWGKTQAVMRDHSGKVVSRRDVTHSGGWTNEYVDKDGTKF